MPALLRDRTARLLLATASVGSLTDWVLFATMVTTVDALLGGGPWATAAVLVARIVPGVCFAPLAARRIDRVPLLPSLLAHEVVRVVAVVLLLGAATTTSAVAAVVGILVLEMAAAMQAAGRESLTSRAVDPSLFPALNTATAVLSYAFLPVGPLVVRWVGPSTGWLLVLAGYGLVAAAYARTSVRDRRPVVATTGTDLPSVAAETTGTGDRGWLRLTVAASLGLVPAVAMFAVGPTLAGTWLGDRTATGPLYAVVLAGAALGLVAANRRRPPAALGMLVAAGGVLVAGTGAWAVGLVLLGAGAGSAYVDLQTRLQTAATDPSEFAAAFAVLKASTGTAVLGAPAVVALGGLPLLVGLGAFAAVVGAAVSVGADLRPATLLRGVLREVVAAVLHRLVDLRVEGVARRVDGPAVVVSNHPHVADGALAMLADRSLRPVARWQPQRSARALIWLADSVVTTAGTGRDPRPAWSTAVAHLGDGGRIWLAPEGGSHQEPTLRRPRSGAVRMAAAAGVPVQPLGIRWHDGTAGPRLSAWRPWRRPVVTLEWGEPVLVRADDEDVVVAEGDRVMRALADVTGLPYASAAVPVAS